MQGIGMKPIGEIFRDFREEKGWTLEILSQKSGICKALLRHYESGAVYPSLMNFIALADALEASMDDLVGRKPPGKE